MATAEQRREPTLFEMLDDPVVQAVMRRDGVSQAEVLALMTRMRERLRARVAPRPLAA